MRAHLSNREVPTRPVFVVSPGRSGSQMLAHMLRLHPDILAFHEPSPGLHTEGYAAWRGLHSRQRIERRLYARRHDLVRQGSENGYLYLESSHYCSLLIPHLASLFRARFIHIARNGRDFVTSGLRRPWYQRQESPALGWLRRTMLLPVGQAGTDHRLAPPNRYRSRFARITWLWTEYNRIILRDLAAVPAKDKLFVRLEELDERLIANVLSFLGLTPKEPGTVSNMLAVARTRPNRSQANASAAVSWNCGDEEQFMAIARETMVALGYGSARQ